MGSKLNQISRFPESQSADVPELKQEQLMKSKAEISKLKLELFGVTKKLNEEVAAMTTEWKTAQQQNMDLLDVLQTVETERDDLQAVVKQSQRGKDMDITSVQDEMSTMQSKYEHLDRDVEEMRKTLDALKESISNTKEDPIQTPNTIASGVRSDNMLQEKDHGNPERKFTQLRSNSAQIMGDIEHLKTDSAKIEINIDSLRTKTQRLQRKYL